MSKNCRSISEHLLCTYMFQSCVAGREPLLVVKHVGPFRVASSDHKSSKHLNTTVEYY